jgi:phosphatidylinositol alpha-mannosyltransferase
VVGTLVSQTLLNIVALLILGGAMFATSSYFDDRWQGLALFALTPIVGLAAVLLRPCCSGAATTGARRAGCAPRAARSRRCAAA